MHGIATVSSADIILSFAFDGDCVARKAGIDGAAAGPEILTEAAPTDARNDRLGGNAVAHGPAKATAGNVHGA